MENMPTKELVETRNNNKGVMEEHIKEMNFQQNLPSLNELHDYLSYLIKLSYPTALSSRVFQTTVDLQSIESTRKALPAVELPSFF